MTVRQTQIAAVRRYVVLNPGATVLAVGRGTKLDVHRVGPLLLSEVRAGRMVREKGCGPLGGFGYYAQCRKHEDCRETSALGRACLARRLREETGAWLNELTLFAEEEL